MIVARRNSVSVSLIKNKQTFAIAMAGLAGLLLAFSAVSLRAQNTPSTQVGLPSNGVFSGGSIDSVQLNNGNLHIDIPLLHLPGIGMDTDMHLIYDSKVASSKKTQTTHV